MVLHVIGNQSNTSLPTRKIKQYDYFGYSVDEALFLSDKEETIINGILETIRQEYNANMDKYSQDVLTGYFTHEDLVTKGPGSVLSDYNMYQSDYFLPKPDSDLC